MAWRPPIVLRVIVGAAVGLVLMAGPVAADPPRPGHYTSEITDITPDLDGFEVRVIGGDSFLELEAVRGTEVIVLGYDDEPYLRFLPDGHVEENRNSPAPYLNEDRYARVEVPAHLTGPDAGALEPDWQPVASGHRYAWHDHRVHWMAPNPPPGVPRGSDFDWNGPVPLLVDGERVEVHGSITLHHRYSPLPWLVGAAGVAVGLVVLLRRFPGRGWAALPAVVAGGAVAVSRQEFAAAPVGSGATPTAVVLAATTFGLAVVAACVPDKLRSVALLAVAATSGGWVMLRFGVLTNPILPTELPRNLDRAVTTASIGLSLALAATAFLELSTPSQTSTSSGDGPGGSPSGRH